MEVFRLNKSIIIAIIIIPIVVIAVAIFLMYNAKGTAISSKIISVKNNSPNTSETFFTETKSGGPSSYLNSFYYYNINEKQLNEIYKSADKYDIIGITVEINNPTKYRLAYFRSLTKGLDDIWIEKIASSEAFVVVDANSTKEIVFSAVVKIEGKSEEDLTNLVRSDFTKIKYSYFSESQTVFNKIFHRYSSLLK
jgi:hypothetical protein